MSVPQTSAPGALAPAEAPAAPIQGLAGVNVLLMGPAGSGKTHALGTLVDAGLEVFYIAMEPGLEALLGYWVDRNLPVPANLHWHVVKAPDASFVELLDQATKINSMSLEMLAKMTDLNRTKYNQFRELYSVLNNFVDQRTGKAYGSVDKFETSCAVCIDGLTGINTASMLSVVGGKPMKNVSDWGLAQQQVESLLRKLTENMRCHFILLGHVEREKDEVLGGIKLMVSTLGAKLAPKVPAMFSDVILTVRDGAKWSWDTANAMADLKTRSLPVAQGLPPSFEPIIKKWRARDAAIRGAV
jgi:hypothetical protein